MSDGYPTATPSDAVCSTRTSRPPLWVPLLFVIVASGLIRLFNLDQEAARWFWSSEAGWRWKHSAVVKLLYEFGTLPALISGAVGALLWVGSFRFDRLMQTRTFGLYLALSLLLGPGLLVNVIFKDHYGRPRPRQVNEFGGKQEFRAVGSATFDAKNKSFPCGHASMGFFWFAPALYCWKQRRRLAVLLLAAGIVHGGAMGWGRMAQGGHWLSDVIWSAAFVYFTAWAAWWLLQRCDNFLIRPSSSQMTASSDEGRDIALAKK